MKTLLALVLALVLVCPCLGACADTLVYEEEWPVGSIIGDAIGVSPELAARGEYAIGVRTLDIVNPDQVDLSAITEENPRPLYDRPLTIEVWYPGVQAEGQQQLCTYTDYLGQYSDGNLTPFDFEGRAMRDAEAFAADGPYPVIIISHGYPGSRYLLSNLGENLATKGYVVISIGHTDNVYEDFSSSYAFYSAVVNRSLDQRFMVSYLETLNSEGFLAGLLDTEHVGMIGYSFGGYGLLRTLGIKLNDGTMEQLAAIADLVTEAEDYEGDKRVDAAVLFAPYGAAMFDADSFTNITVPTLWIQGNVDVTVPYEGVRDMFAKSVNSDRYFVTYELLSHKAATNPAPLMSQSLPYASGARRWEDCVWDQRYVNGINFHFVTAFMDAQLKGDTDKMEYLTVTEPVGRNCVYKVDENGNFTEEHTYWKGFAKETAVGLILDHLDKE